MLTRLTDTQGFVAVSLLLEKNFNNFNTFEAVSTNILIKTKDIHRGCSRLSILCPISIGFQTISDVQSTGCTGPLPSVPSGEARKRCVAIEYKMAQKRPYRRD